MISSGAISRVLLLLCATWLLLLAGAYPGAAQNPSGDEPMTVCSRNDQKFPPQTGLLIQYDQNYIVIQTSAGLVQYSRKDFQFCHRGDPGPTPCPAGQIADAGRCTCPGAHTLSNGRCITVDTIPGPQPTRCQDQVTAQGSSTVGLGVMPFLIQSFANVNGFKVTRTDDDDNKVRMYRLQNGGSDSSCLLIIVRSTGSNTAKEAIVDGRAQIGMSSRYYTDDEIQVLAKAANLGPVERSSIEHVVALDDISIVVNSRNSVNALELCKVANIFAGKNPDWVAPNANWIGTHIGTDTSGTLEVFKSLVMENCHLSLSDKAESHGTYAALLNAVAKDETSIGYAPSSLVNEQVKTISLKGNCGITQTATSWGIKTEDFLLSRRLYVFTPLRLSGYAGQFVNFIISDERSDDVLLMASLGDRLAQELGERGAFDQKIEVMRDDHADSLNADETRADSRSLENFDKITANGKRVSITYRFNINSDQLDTKARQDIVRLARYLKSMQTPPTVLLAGFTDNVGKVDANLALAKKRAGVVRSALVQQSSSNNPDRIRAEGFGKILPVACNDTGLGKAKNRRVEVFLVP
jgi:phosphate transport system substrate-binding protein